MHTHRECGRRKGRRDSRLSGASVSLLTVLPLPLLLLPSHLCVVQTCFAWSSSVLPANLIVASSVVDLLVHSVTRSWAAVWAWADWAWASAEWRADADRTDTTMARWRPQEAAVLEDESAAV